MIKCEICGRYFTPDEIVSCPKCGKELCEECYQSHVPNCLFSEIFDKED